MKINSLRRIIFFLFIFFHFITGLSAQTYQTDTIFYNGSSSKFINIVFVSEGFQSTELSAYITNVQNLTNYLFNITPFKEYKNYFNVFAVRVPSTQSGADHPATASDEGSSGGQPVLTVNTYFNSTFDYASIHRLLVCTNYSAVNSVLSANFPLYDQTMILVNSPYYGGSGGANATSSLNTSSYEVLVHETGHSFAGLADEYYAGDSYAGEKANMTTQTNPALVKWKNWIGYNSVGIYQHCCGGNSALWYRPHNNCKMRALNNPFCPVCIETIVERIHLVFGTPINSFQPGSTTVNYCNQPLTFKINTIKPIPNTLRVKWKLNGNYILSNIDSITINSVQLNAGTNTLIAEVLDTSSLTRSDTHPTSHLYTTTWTINKNSIPVITASGPVNLCPGGSVTLTSTSGSTYLWSTGQTTQSIVVNTTGSFSVTTNQCLTSVPTITKINYCSFDITTRVFIEGFYLGSSSMNASADPVNHPLLCDTLTLQLARPTSPYNILYSTTSTITIFGYATFHFNTLPEYDQYYLVLRHRNSIATWSSMPVSINASITDYKFSTSSAKAYGNNLRDLQDGNFAILSGDINQDGVVESSDYSDMENALSISKLGYSGEDITGDRVVESSDYSLMENNVYYTVVVIMP